MADDKRLTADRFTQKMALLK